MGEFAFTIVAAIVIATAVWVVTARNLVHSAVALLGTLFGIAGLYVFLYADFLAATQVVVYVGGILVLIIFGVMLTHKISGPLLIQTNMPGGWAAAVISSFVLMGLAALLFRTPWHQADGGVGEPTTEIIGHSLMSKYLLHFEVASVLLLVALLGATYLSRRDDG